MRSIEYRLTNITSKHAFKALSLLHVLLLSGPEAVLSESVNFLPKISLLLDPNTWNIGTMEYLMGQTEIGSSIVTELRPKAEAVIQLLTDHDKLCNQRKWSQLWRNGAFPHLRYVSTKADVLQGSSYAAKTLSSMDELQLLFRPEGVEASRSPSSVVYLDLPSTSASARSDVDPFASSDPFAEFSSSSSPQTINGDTFDVFARQQQGAVPISSTSANAADRRSATLASTVVVSDDLIDLDFP